MKNLIEEAYSEVEKYRNYLTEAQKVTEIITELPDPIKELKGVSISSFTFEDELSITISFHQTLAPEVDAVRVLKTEGVIELTPSSASDKKSCNYKGGKLVVPSGQEIKFEVFRGNVPPACHIESLTEMTPVTTYKVICDQAKEEILV